MAQNASNDYECTYFGYWLGTILHVTEEGGMKIWSLVKTWYWALKNVVSTFLDDDDLQDMGHSPNVLFEKCFKNISYN